MIQHIYMTTTLYTLLNFLTIKSFNQHKNKILMDYKIMIYCKKLKIEMIVFSESTMRK